MKLSVIIPVYNCETYLPACIESVCAQTYRNLQIILINDGSRDNSGKICEAYAKNDARITVIHQENAGVSAARNAGLRVAAGDLIAFADADDYLDADMYAFLIDLMQKHDADIVHCGYRRIVGGSVELEQNSGELYIQNREEAVFCMVAGKVFHCGLWNKIYRYDLIKNLQFREDLKMNEDILFNFQVFMMSNRIVYTSTAKYNYVVHPNSVCHVTKKEKMASDCCTVDNYIYNVLKGTKMESVIRSRRIRHLSDYFRVCYEIKDKNTYLMKKQLRDQIIALAEEGNVYERNMLLTAMLIKWVPELYVQAYKIYDRLRKPNWEPGELER